ncbi:MAG: trypsin-like peptidase domain-containing protein [Holophagales bacterium]|nr:trypsin-like peptidase domain-containing protein [Holophagales bacterium]MBK9963649.1 trypsin-like peptidase domain-containing protein [Holophagales bacterium]
MSRHLPAAIAALAFLAAPATAQRPEPDAPRGEAAPRRGGDDLRRNPIVRAVEQIGPSVVNISAERLVMRRASPLDYFGAPGDRGRRSESLGSGVVLDGSGIVVTNDHVISGASKIIVTTADGRELEAELLGADADNDLAVLKVDGKGLKPVRVGTTADLMIGETAIAVGNPFGLSNTVTTGIVSALQRTVKGEGRTYTDFIQTDAAINPGNSGGALCNVLGELIGINTAIVGGANTIGFAIPVERVRRIADDLLRFGEVKPVWIGVRGTTLTAGRARPSARGLGMRVRSVYPSSPADVARLEPGDVVLSLNGRTVESREDFDTLLSAVAPGGSVTLEVRRGERTRSVALQAARVPEDLGLEILRREIGISVAQVRGGLALTSVARDSPADRKGLERGDALLGVNGVRIATLDEVARAVERGYGRSGLVLVVGRGGYAYNLTFALD